MSVSLPSTRFVRFLVWTLTKLSTSFLTMAIRGQFITFSSKLTHALEDTQLRPFLIFSTILLIKEIQYRINT